MRANYSYRGNFENNQHTHNVHLLLKIFDVVYDLNVAFWIYHLIFSVNLTAYVTRTLSGRPSNRQ